VPTPVEPAENGRPRPDATLTRVMLRPIGSPAPLGAFIPAGVIGLAFAAGSACVRPAAGMEVARTARRSRSAVADARGQRSSKAAGPIWTSFNRKPGCVSGCEIAWSAGQPARLGADRAASSSAR